ncbi:MAG TPA: hypothetical protein VF769_08520 [Vitreimonas sp.]|jgi:hypothetical protein
MVTLDPLVARLLLAVAVALLMLGAVTAWTSANVIKRVVGVVLACLGALGGLAALGAPHAVLVLGAGAALAQLAMGVALAVRLQEAYGGVEAAEFDQADDVDEPAEPKA